MYVCICRAVTERDVHHAIATGARSVRQLRDSLGVCSGCCKCAPHVRSLLPGRVGCHRSSQGDTSTLIAQPA